MMEMDDEEALRLIELFREKAADRRHQLRLIAVQQSEDDHKHQEVLRHRKEEEERQANEALATPAQVAAFEERLDTYDTATVKALMDNQHVLDAIQKERETLEASAYRLPDGRMVFKSDDGRHVFDKHGTELGPDVIDPRAIPDNCMRWSAEQRINNTENAALDQRSELHDFQHRLDEARETVGKGEAAADVLARTEANLKLHMPAAVAQELAGSKPAIAASAADSILSIAPERVPPRPSAPAPVAP